MSKNSTLAFIKEIAYQVLKILSIDCHLGFIINSFLYRFALLVTVIFIWTADISLVY